MKKIEEKELKDAGNKRAKEIAEQKYRVSDYEIPSSSCHTFIYVKFSTLPSTVAINIGL